MTVSLVLPMRAGLMVVADCAAVTSAGPARTATIGYPMEPEACPPTGLAPVTLAPGLDCGSGAMALIRWDGARAATSAAAVDARALMPSVLALVSATSETVRRGALIWWQAGALGDVPLLRTDVSFLRGGLPGGAPLPGWVPVANIAGPGPGFDPSDVVFPGEAAARFLMWRQQRGRVLEWTGWWGSVLVPFGAARASSIVEVKEPRSLVGFPSLAFPKQGFDMTPPFVLPVRPNGSRAAPLLPAPVPLSGGFGLLLAALWGTSALRRKERALSRRADRSRSGQVF